jgi:hypothetical protein
LSHLQPRLLDLVILLNEFFIFLVVLLLNLKFPLRELLLAFTFDLVQGFQFLPLLLDP